MEPFRLIMEFLVSIELTVPLFQIVLFLFFGTLLLLFRKVKLALLMSYVFSYYWGFVLNKDVLINSFTESPDYAGFLYLYFGFGFIVLILAIIGFLAPE